MPLTERQKRFVEEYLVDLNATQAAIRAGYGERAARQTGSAILARPDVAQAVAAAQAARSERVGLTQDWVLGRLREVAGRCMRHEDARDREGKPAEKSAFNATGANKALELIGRHLGMFVERTETVNLNFAVSGEPVSEEEWEKRHGRPA